MKNIGIYIHIPFCKKKCDYCDFVSYTKSEEIQNKYVQCLLKTIEQSKNKLTNYIVNTIYFGGGTPSYINSKNIIKIMETIKNNFKISDNVEITIEINPGTISKEKLLDYKICGINRVSIGCQAIQDDLLKMLGRIHTYEEFLNTYRLVQNVGFENINVDLMLGLPNQKLEDIEKSVKEIVKLNPNHISVYSLIVEKETRIEKRIAEGELILPEEDLERKMYKKVKEILKRNNYKHYEISNFAKENFESKHNVSCWEQEEYLGVGVASHSYFDNKRFSNIEEINEFIENIENNNYEKNIIVHEIQSEEDKRKEYMLLGLRKLGGVSISKFEQKFRINPLFYFRYEISILEEQGLLEVDLDNIKLTDKGLDFANIVWEKFV